MLGQAHFVLAIAHVVAFAEGYYRGILFDVVGIGLAAANARNLGFAWLAVGARVLALLGYTGIVRGSAQKSVQARIMSDPRRQYLKDQFLTAAIVASLARWKSYVKSASKQTKKKFRDDLGKKLCMIASRYRSPVGEVEHLANIRKLAESKTFRFASCLRHRRLRIGIAQKSLNLYLKYLWCLDEIPAPPHCPFDSIVISHLSKQSQLNWTSIDTPEQYMQLVYAARKVAGKSSLAEWELKIFKEHI